MAPPSQPNHDSAPAQSTSNSLQVPAPQSQGGVTAPIPTASDLNNIQLQGLDQNQIISILRHLPLLSRVSHLCLYQARLERIVFFSCIHAFYYHSWSDRFLVASVVLISYT